MEVFANRDTLPMKRFLLEWHPRRKTASSIAYDFGLLRAQQRILGKGKEFEHTNFDTLALLCPIDTIGQSKLAHKTKMRNIKTSECRRFATVE